MNVSEQLQAVQEKLERAESWNKENTDLINRIKNGWRTLSQTGTSPIVLASLTNMVTGTE